MKSRTLINIAVFALSIAGLFAWGYVERAGTQANVREAGRADNSKSVLTAPEAFHDFGTISMKNGNVSKEFTVTNSTNENVTVKTVFTSCMCTTALIVQADGSTKGPFGMPGHGGAVPPANELIKAGESRTIRVVYDPNAHGPAGVGQTNRFIIVTDAYGGNLQLEIKALVTP